MKLTIVDDGIAPELHPAFWNEFVVAASNISALVQAPAYRIDADALANAYMKDWRASRRRAALTEAKQ